MSKPKQELWLYHPGLEIPERGYTGRYRPAGVDPLTGNPQIELEVVYKKGEEPYVIFGEGSK